MDTLTLIPVNISKPLLYVLDVIKDMVQLLLLLTAVGGLSFAVRYWSSFSSGVSICNISEYATYLRFITLFRSYGVHSLQ